MSTYLTDAEELARRFDLAQHTSRHHHRIPPTHPRRRTRVAAGLRRVADRLEQ